MDFSEALHLIKSGKRACRTGWATKGKWVFLVPGSRITIAADRPLGQVAPELVGETATYRPHIDARKADGSIGPWNPSQEDVLADDWEVANHA